MIFIILACRNTLVDLPESKVSSSTPITESVQSKEPVKLAFFEASSPLQRTEVMIDQWPEDVIQTTSNSVKVVGLSNLLRSPCVEEYQSGLSLGESIVNQGCGKALDWVNFIDEKLNTTSADDFLFSYALPGPYWGPNSEGIEVFVHADAPELSLVLERIHQLQMSVFVIQHQDSKLIGISKCDGQNMTEEERYSLNKCHNISVNEKRRNAYQSFISSDYSSSSPVWMLNGYLVRGLQSVRMLQHYQQYP